MNRCSDPSWQSFRCLRSNRPVLYDQTFGSTDSLWSLLAQIDPSKRNTGLSSVVGMPCASRRNSLRSAGSPAKPPVSGDTTEEMARSHHEDSLQHLLWLRGRKEEQEGTAPHFFLKESYQKVWEKKTIVMQICMGTQLCRALHSGAIPWSNLMP